MFASGRKPQSAMKGVIASAISGLWFGSTKSSKHQSPDLCGGGHGLTFVNLRLLDMQRLCCRLVRMALYTERLLNGQYFEEEGEIAIPSAKFPRAFFSSQALVPGKRS